jgi:hypothetical protein
VLQVRQAQQMSSLVTRKKSELAAKVQRLQERHASLSAALDSSGSEGQQGPGGGGAVTEAEWKAKYDAVKAQLPAYKAMKKELAELEAEVGMLLCHGHTYCFSCLTACVFMLRSSAVRSACLRCFSGRSTQSQGFYRAETLPRLPAAHLSQNTDCTVLS